MDWSDVILEDASPRELRFAVTIRGLAYRNTWLNSMMESFQRESEHHLECIRQLEALVEVVKLELSDLHQQMVDKEFEDIQVTDEIDLLWDVIC